MLIKCENCSVVYEVSKERLALERPHFLKCSTCGSVFEAPVLEEDVLKTPALQEEQEELPAPEDSIPPVEQSDAVPMPLSDIFQPNESENEEEKQEEPEASPEKEVDLFEPLESTEEFTPLESAATSGDGRVLWALFGLVVSLGAIFLMFYVGKFFFIRKMPVTEKVYQSVGIKTDVLGEGLSFQDTLFDIVKKDQNYGLLVKTQIVNITDETKKIPNVVVRLLNENNEITQTQYILLNNEFLAAGQSKPIETQLKTLSEDAKRIEITFERNG